jgi:hypothetical protein
MLICREHPSQEFAACLTLVPLPSLTDARCVQIRLVRPMQNPFTKLNHSRWVKQGKSKETYMWIGANY